VANRRLAAGVPVDLDDFLAACDPKPRGMSMAE